MFSDNPWSKFAKIIIPPINNEKDKSVGLLLGLSPGVHGKHRKSCQLILHYLFKSIKNYLPQPIAYDYMAFRGIYGIRAGNCKMSRKEKISAYHIHSTETNILTQLENACYNYAREHKELPRIFNIPVSTCNFPKDNKNRLNESKKIAERLNNIKK